MRLASPNPCWGPIVSSVRSTIRSSVPCSTSFDILEESRATHLECQHERPGRGHLQSGFLTNPPPKHRPAASPLLVHSDRFAEHQTPPGHPERPERAEV